MLVNFMVEKLKIEKTASVSSKHVFRLNKMTITTWNTLVTKMSKQHGFHTFLFVF